MHCFRGYCCGNYLEPVVQWTKLGLPRTQSQTRLGQVSTWMGDHTYWSVHFNSRFSSTSLIELFELSLRVTYCVSRTVHDTNASCQSIAELQAKQISVLNFTPGWSVQGFWKSVPHGKDWHCQQNPNQLMRHIVLTVAKLPGNIGQRHCLLNINAAWKQET